MIRPSSSLWSFCAVVAGTVACSSCSREAHREFVRPPLETAPSSQSFFSVSSSFSSSPDSVLIHVPFSPQAPFALWDPLHEEACEEMSLIMVERYWRNARISAEDAELELQKLIAWETEHGYPEDVTMDQLAEIARRYYGLQATVETGVTVERMRQLVAEGKPVILPAAGRMLGNPYFSGDGPWYHALVLVGYEGNTMITNDPGTKRGMNFRYSAEVLQDAMHDWNGRKEDIGGGRKAVLVVTK